MRVLESRWPIPTGVLLFAAAAVAGSLQAWGTSFVLAIIGLALFTAQGFAAAGVNRIGLALVVAPLVLCLVLATIYSGEWWLAPALMYAYFFGLAGVPGYFLFRRLGWLRLWQVVAGGGLLGAAMGFALLGVAWPSGVSQFFAFGALTAAAFWVIAFAGRPSGAAAPK